MLVIKIPGDVVTERGNRPDNPDPCDLCGHVAGDHFEYNSMTEHGIRSSIGIGIGSLMFYDVYQVGPRRPRHGIYGYEEGHLYPGTTMAMVEARTAWVKEIVRDWGESLGLSDRTIQKAIAKLADPHW